jgi:hypothetical protein
MVLPFLGSKDNPGQSDKSSCRQGPQTIFAPAEDIWGDIRLKEDLSETGGEPQTLFYAVEAPWSRMDKARGNNVTDAPWLHLGKTGKLYMIWGSHGKGGYNEGIAISASGKLAGPWTQQVEPPRLPCTCHSA